MNEIVGTKTIRNKDNQLEYPYTLQLLNSGHSKNVLRLQHSILSVLEKPEVCVYLSEAEIESMLGDFGEMVGVYVENTMVAFAAVLFPGEREVNLGKDIGLAKKELKTVAHLEFAAVHPAYRGNSLQKKMAEYLVELVIKDGSYNYLLNTVSPYNPISLHTDFYLQFTISSLSRKYGGVLRYIMLRDLKNPLIINKNSIISAAVTDLDKQQELLETGYYGFDFADNTKRTIMFGRGMQ